MKAHFVSLVGCETLGWLPELLRGVGFELATLTFDVVLAPIAVNVVFSAVVFILEVVFAVVVFMLEALEGERHYCYTQKARRKLTS